MASKFRFALPRSLVVCALAALAAPAPTSAQTRLDDILACGALRVGTTSDYPPFTARASRIRSTRAPIAKRR
jgi:ABC-type amino acid transport substrate-binding protein